MPYSEFPDIQYFIVPYGNDPTDAGSFQLDESVELSRMQLHVQKKGAHAGTEKIRVMVYGESTLTAPLATSDWVSVADIDSLTSSSWAGYITFDFNRQHLSANRTYYLAVELDGYTNPGDDSYYWGFALDWPNDINEAAEPGERGLQFSLFGYK